MSYPDLRLNQQGQSYSTSRPDFINSNTAYHSHNLPQQQSQQQSLQEQPFDQHSLPQQQHSFNFYNLPYSQPQQQQQSFPSFGLSQPQQPQYIPPHLLPQQQKLLFRPRVSIPAGPMATTSRAPSTEPMSSFFDDEFFPPASVHSSGATANAHMLLSAQYPNFRLSAPISVPRPSVVADSAFTGTERPSTVMNNYLPNLETYMDINPGHYENLTGEDWSRAAIVDDAASPSTIGSEDSALLTPVTDNDSFGPESLFSRHLSDFDAKIPVHSLNVALPPINAAQLSSSYPGLHSGTSYFGTFRGIDGLPTDFSQVSSAPDISSFGLSFHQTQQALALPPQFVRDLLMDSDEDSANNLAADDDDDDDDADVPSAPGSEQDDDDLDPVKKVARLAASHDEDGYLVELRRQNFSYAQIKETGKFPQAISTLRGRYRNAIKPKDERVRRPQWKPEDEILLTLAVEHFQGKGKGRSKVPWSKISTLMKKNGASYKFAPAACSKKWDDMRHLTATTPNR